MNKLNLESNNIGDEGAILIVEALIINSSLVELNLRNNRIKLDGALTIGIALKINKTLTSLDIGIQIN
jgi:Ran GTPase-activating protein (RanGAP) involved in mRNA processing and transport